MQNEPLEDTLKVMRAFESLGVSSHRWLAGIHALRDGAHYAGRRYCGRDAA